MRSLEPLIEKDLKSKMVFLGGPRQVGKTTLAENILGKLRTAPGGGLYFNWDDDLDRRKILARKWSADHKLLVFDEIHKYPRWKNWLKGIYDKQKREHSFLITGSARLDLYKRGGDSLLGRYHYWRLHPFDLSEIPIKIGREKALDRLMTVGGFPEPFILGNLTEARRWRRERFDRILRDDIRDLEPVQDIQNLSLFVDALRSRVGGLVVLSNIAEDLQVSQKTLKRWLNILENMYLVFVVRPYTKNISRAIQKPPKVYFFDNGDVLGAPGAVFENLVACHLLKKIHFLEDSQGYRYELRYIRDKSKREVDFVIIKDGRVDELVEVKYGEDKPATSLCYYDKMLNPRLSRQIVYGLDQSFDHGAIKIQTPFDAMMPGK